jgi:hypothetical protein
MIPNSSCSDPNLLAVARMRSRALTSPFGGAPRLGAAPAFISASSSHSDFLIDKVTDLSVNFK